VSRFFYGPQCSSVDTRITRLAETMARHWNRLNVTIRSWRFETWLFGLWKSYRSLDLLAYHGVLLKELYMYATTLSGQRTRPLLSQ